MGLVIVFYMFYFSSPECLQAKGFPFPHPVVIPLQIGWATQGIGCFCQAGQKMRVRAWEGAISQDRKEREKRRASIFRGPQSLEGLLPKKQCQSVCYFSGSATAKGLKTSGREYGQEWLTFCCAFVSFFSLIPIFSCVEKAKFTALAGYRTTSRSLTMPNAEG